MDKYLAEKERYENDKREVQRINNFTGSDILKLNVGGTHHLLSSRKVLCSVPGSTLEKMFSGLHTLQKIDDQVFIDRDGQTFERMLNYLRNDRKLWPEFKTEGEVQVFQQELKYWGIRDETVVELKTQLKFPK